MTILVSGAKGFTACFVWAKLQRCQCPFAAWLRLGTNTSWKDAHQIPVCFADLNCTPNTADLLKGCDALFNVASIGFGAATSILLLRSGRDGLNF